MAESTVTQLWIDRVDANGVSADLETIERLLDQAPDKQHPYYHYLEGFAHGRAYFERFGGVQHLCGGK